VEVGVGETVVRVTSSELGVVAVPVTRAEVTLGIVIVTVEEGLVETSGTLGTNEPSSPFTVRVETRMKAKNSRFPIVV